MINLKIEITANEAIYGAFLMCAKHVFPLPVENETTEKK